jgi:2-polyprenyl-3-methyl-5-hydroxy-6-metoxy-1,4-benzoquinol methylase
LEGRGVKYDHYANTIKKSAVAEKIRHRLYSRLAGTPASVLEFGVGHGYFRNYCKRKGIVYTGVDFCEGLSDGQTIITPIPEGMDIVPSGYDLILAEHFIEHMKDYDTVMLFLEGCKQKLNKDGRIVLMYPNMNRHFWHDPTHQYPTNKTRIERCLTDAGFTVKESDNYAHCLTGSLDTLPLRIAGWVMPPNARFSLHFCIHSYTIGE